MVGTSEVERIKSKLKYKNEELEQIKLDNNIQNSKSNDEEVSFAINFISDTQDIMFPMICKQSDLISRLEEKVYYEYPKYKDINTFNLVRYDQLLSLPNKTILSLSPYCFYLFTL